MGTTVRTAAPKSQEPQRPGVAAPEVTTAQEKQHLAEQTVEAAVNAVNRNIRGRGKAGRIGMPRQQAVFRAAGNHGFTKLDNRLLQNRNLSRRSKGLAVEMLSYPPDYHLTAAGLVQSGQEGRDAVWSMLRELMEHGYVMRASERNEAGVFEQHAYLVSDDPEVLIRATAEELLKKENATHGIPVRGPLTAYPCTGKP